ncbi:MAG TPA: hypothetical protein VN643_18620 [Pyrinomonadaceae bacterium]|nr:hypothetical protein [Pyrinomonadaceae bacterium]
MTIAIGFEFNEGVLFCADTKITTDIKTNESKITTCWYGNKGESCACVSVFTLAGNLPYARAAIEECEHAIAALDFKDGTTVSLDGVQNAIRSALTKFYRRYIYPQGDSRPDFQLLIGLSLWGKTRILSTYEATMREVTGGFQCLGAGAYLAQHYIKQFMPTGDEFNREKVTLTEVRLIAEWVLDRLMEYDESCGGSAEFMVLQHNGEIGDLSGPVWIRPDLVRDLQSATWGFLRRLSLVGDRDGVELAVEAFERDVRSIGESHVGWWEHIESIRKTRQGD